MKLKFSNSKNNIFFKLITRPVIIITSHLLFLKVHFLVKPNAYLLGKFAAQRGGEVDPDIVYNYRPSCIDDVEKKGLCSTVQPNMVTQPTFSDAGKAQTRLLYNFLKSLSSINNLRKKLDSSGT